MPLWMLFLNSIAEEGKNNIAFACYFLSGNVEKCIDLLITTERIAEAAFLARTYMPR